MIFWEENNVEGRGLFYIHYRWTEAYVFDFSRWEWFQQRRDFQLGPCATQYEHPEFWAGILDFLLSPTATNKEYVMLPPHMIVRWSYFGTPTQEQIEDYERWSGKIRNWNASFIKVAVTRLTLLEELHGAYRLLEAHKAPSWYDARTSVWERLRDNESIV